jgi:hypothetical protein
MKRRSLLKGAAAVAIGAACPGWIRSAFAEEACTRPAAPQRGLIAMSEAFRTAQRANRPLLVLVIPQDEGARWLPAHSFGELLNHGTADQLLPLAMLEVVCAKMKTVRKLVPTAPAGEPLMLLIETDRSPATARALNAKLPEYKEVRGQDIETDYRKTMKEREEGEDELISKRIAILSDLIRSATVDDASWMAAHVATARAALSPDEVAQVDSGHVNDDLILRAGALAVSSAMQPDLIPPLKAQLLKSIQGRLTQQSPRGTRWATSSGCGVDIEGEAPEIVGCGMGHTPPRSRRFLYFFKRSYPGDAETAED